MIYTVNEVFYSLQGEGVRAGTPNVFVRFAGCNLTCKRETHGFDCDTEFTGGRKVAARDLIREALDAVWECVEPAHKSLFKHVGVIFTGGEPGLQVDAALVAEFQVAGFFTAIETNGTVDVSGIGLDWITVSPKVAEHALVQKTATEVKYVRHYGQAVPKSHVQAQHYLLSPAAGPEGVDRKALDWCISLCKDNPPWRLSVQQHKQWGVR